MATVEEQKKMVQAMCKHFASRPWEPLLKKQRDTSHDAPARGGVWISRTSFPAPKDTGLRDALYAVIDHLKEDYHNITPAKDTPILDVGVEFIGNRSGVSKNEPEPDISEIEKLKNLQKELKSDMTILYVHGGGLYFSNPAEYRAASARLAKMTGARVASIKYRLAPIHTFPAPVLDTLVAYASLLYPPEGAPYAAVPANKIVLAGNSAGVNLTLGLTKFLIELQRLPNPPTISFHGQTITLPLPAGVTAASGWCDPCDACPSWHVNGEYDYLTVLQPACMPNHPTDEIWPSNPPREHPYCAGATLDHELVCPSAVRDWSGAPPMWFAVGSEERGLDGNRVVASQAAKSGVPVVWNEYEGMLHEFSIIMAKLPQAKHCFDRWADACKKYSAGDKGSPSSSKWLMPDCKYVDLGKPEDLSPISHNELRKKMKEYNATRPVWTGKLGEARL